MVHIVEFPRKMLGTDKVGLCFNKLGLLVDKPGLLMASITFVNKPTSSVDKPGRIYQRLNPLYRSCGFPCRLNSVGHF